MDDKALEDLVKRGKEITTGSPVKLTHRTKNSSLTIDQIDPTAIRKTRQGRKGEYVGFYTYDTSGENEESSKHLDAQYGEHKIDYVIPAGSKVLDLTDESKGLTSRINQKVAKFFLSKGFDAVIGFDYIGPVEWVILRLASKGKDAEFVEAQKGSKIKESILRDFIKEALKNL